MGYYFELVVRVLYMQDSTQYGLYETIQTERKPAAATTWAKHRLVASNFHVHHPTYMIERDTL